MRRFMIDRVGFDGVEIYENSRFTFESGVTVLVGCNGSGKTTLMEKVIACLKNKGIAYYKYYGTEADSKLSYQARQSGNEDLMKAYLLSGFMSEGEHARSNFALFAGSIGDFVMKKCAEEKEAWVFIDSMDSGLSIDVLRKLKEFLFGTVIVTKPVGLDLHIVLAANSFELVKGCDCIDVQTAQHLTFDNYDNYGDFIMRTRREKDGRPKPKGRGALDRR